ncbi:unnamed protein product [Cladocopium goreaui]|uniref:Kelch domain-containing protein 3 n=1 Tax=Cladocopium goreaui TaxID=2562237 RepID=A0A9P1DG67_9DINO|nr:unnamed protein product [Cladocopium goreaui]
MEPCCEPLKWTQPLQLPRAGSGEDFLWSQPGSFQDREVYGHSASVVRNTVWVLGGKNQAGKRISVSLSRSSTAAMGCQWPVLEC